MNAEFDAGLTDLGDIQLYCWRSNVRDGVVVRIHRYAPDGKRWILTPTGWREYHKGGAFQPHELYFIPAETVTEIQRRLTHPAVLLTYDKPNAA